MDGSAGEHLLPLPYHVRPKVRLFLSADIVGSTGFKQERISLSPLFKRKGFEINSDTQPWPSFFIEFFSILTRMFKMHMNDRMLEGRVSMDDHEAPRLWKSLGDEVITTKIIVSEDEAAVTLQCWIDAAADARVFIRKYSDSLDVKLSAWTAEFPASNSEVAYFHKMHNEGQLFPELRDALFDFERKCIENSKSKSNLPVEQGILNSSILELYYNRKDSGEVVDHIVRDYIGPSIDNGFRIAEHASPVWMPISIELAYFISRSNFYQDQEGFKISRMDRQRLKGVMGGRPYPIFYIDLAASTKNKFKVEQAYRDLVETANESLKPEKIHKYCKDFFDDNRNYFYRPFIPKNSLSYIPDHVKDEEILTDFANQIENFAIAYYGQCEIFSHWYEEQGYDADKVQQIKNGLRRIYPLDSKENYQSRIFSWLEKNLDDET